MAYRARLLFHCILLIGDVLKGEKITTIDNVDYEVDTIAPVLYGDDFEQNLPYVWGGFEKPRQLVEMWKEWHQSYKERRQKQMEEDEEHEPALEFPPWSYDIINVGLPHYCSLVPSHGPCKEENQTRFAYHPYAHQCLEFEYGGCYGNENNFDNKTECEEMCPNKIWPPDRIDD